MLQRISNAWLIDAFVSSSSKAPRGANQLRSSAVEISLLSTACRMLDRSHANTSTSTVTVTWNIRENQQKETQINCTPFEGVRAREETEFAHYERVKQTQNIPKPWLNLFSAKTDCQICTWLKRWVPDMTAQLETWALFSPDSLWHTIGTSFCVCFRCAFDCFLEIVSRQN